MAVTIPGHRIRDAIGTLFPQRKGMQFTGAGVTVTDDATLGRTLVDIPGGGGSGTTSYATIFKWGTD